MAFIPQEVIDQVRLQADIVDVIQSYIPLKKAGRDFKACCPFHNEKTPSFVVNQQRQWYHCFGCGKHGNVISFVMERENVDFPNAVIILARRYHIYIPEEAPRSRSGEKQYPKDSAAPVQGFKERLYILHEKAQEWFARRLKEAPDSPVAKYLATRGLPPETVEKFGIGASVDQWDAFMSYAIHEGFTEEELIASGLIIKTDDNPPKEYDRFRNRLMFPIWNEQGRVVGFSARTIEKDFKGAKYVNSPETPVFKKGRILYALHLARQEMGRKGYAVLCEGQLDVIAMHRAGIGNAVAPQGTAFTEEQAIMLKRYADTLYLAFDCDSAGTKAVFRGAMLALPQGFNLKVVRFPGGKDPDELLRNSGAEEVVKAVESARDFFEFALEELIKINGTSPAGRAAVAENMLEFILVLESDAAKSAYTTWLAEQLRLDPSALHHQLSKMISRRNSEPRRGIPAQEQVVHAPYAQRVSAAELQYRKALKELLECILSDENAAEAAVQKVNGEMLDDSPFSKAINLVIQMKMLGEWSESPQKILEEFPAEEMDSDLSALLMKEDAGASTPRAVSITFRSCVNVLAQTYYTNQIRIKTERFRELPSGSAERMALVKEISELTRQRALNTGGKDSLGPEPPKTEPEDSNPVGF